MAIKLDFTGLFYELDVTIDQLGANPTVKSLTDFAVGKSGNTGGTLIYANFSPAGFLSSAYIEHRANPQTRQKDTAGNPSPSAALPTGIYGFDDSVSSNRVEGVQISFTLAWQYYIFRDGALVSGSSANSTDRVIVPAAQSSTATPLEEDDIVRWRLVAIGGLQELVEFQMAELAPSQRTRLMTRILTEKMTVRGAARAARELAE